VFHHQCAHGILLNVEITIEQMPRGLDHRCAVPTLPERTGTLIFLVDIERVSAANNAHCPRNAVNVTTRGKNMNVIAHQAIRMHSDAISLGYAGPDFKILTLIGRLIKAQRAVIAALNNVVSHSRDVMSRATRHSKLLLLLIVLWL